MLLADLQKILGIDDNVSKSFRAISIAIL